VTAKAKNSLDLIMISEETLRLTWRFETSHYLLSFSGWSMGPFRSIVETSMASMVNVGR
jgi:hypothetical protein